MTTDTKLREIADSITHYMHDYEAKVNTRLYFLESHEIAKVWNKPIEIERLAQVRDVFIFCALTGLSFSDVKQLRLEHIATDTHGNKWIRKAPQTSR